MKRDMDLIRSILLAVEESPTGRAPSPLVVNGYSQQAVDYHAFLVMEAGLCEGVDVTNPESVVPEAALNRLTWSGHEFPDAARDDTLWNKAKDRVGSTLGDVAIGVFVALLHRLAKESLGLTE